MAKIVIQNLFYKILEVSELQRNVLYHFSAHQIDWMQACGAKGRCTTCKMIIKDGFENLSLPTDAELRYRKIKALADNERLACQTLISGDVTIRVPEPYKLPHISYSE